MGLSRTQYTIMAAYWAYSWSERRDKLMVKSIQHLQIPRLHSRPSYSIRARSRRHVARSCQAAQTCYFEGASQVPQAQVSGWPATIGILVSCLTRKTGRRLYTVMHHDASGRWVAAVHSRAIQVASAAADVRCQVVRETGEMRIYCVLPCEYIHQRCSTVQVRSSS